MGLAVYSGSAVAAGSPRPSAWGLAGAGDTTALAGAYGGTFVYRLPHAVAVYTPAPAGFDPLTASPAQLARYNIPAAPRSGPGLAQWRSAMAELHFVAAPRTLSVLPAHAASSVPDYSDHWAGYVDYGGPYQRVSTTWSEPSFARDRCRAGALTLWAGIGGYGTAYLAQDGTSVGTPGLHRNQAWWEITPAGMVPVPLYATEGSAFTADVSYLGHGRFSFFMENDATGAAWSGSESAGGDVDLSTAEVIAERPCLNQCSGTEARYAELGSFHQVKFLTSLVNGKPIGAFPNYLENMTAAASYDGRQLAQPSRLEGNAMTFTVRQASCS